MTLDVSSDLSSRCTAADQHFFRGSYFDSPRRDKELNLNTVNNSWIRRQKQANSLSYEWIVVRRRIKLHSYHIICLEVLPQDGLSTASISNCST